MIWMILSILLIYLVYYIWIVFNFDKQGNPKLRKKNKDKNVGRKMPAEVKYFVKKYNVDLDKINYRYFLQAIGLIVAIDVSIIASIVIFIEKIWLQMIVIIVLVIILVLVSFGLLGRYFKKKGLTKDVNNKRNRK